MSTFELCKLIRTIIANRASEVMNYTSWDSDFAHQQMLELHDKIKSMKDYKQIDITELSHDEMIELGFGKWSNDSELLLIPLWLFLFVDPEILVISISNDIVKFKDADNDHRYGCLAYGISPLN